MKIFYESLTNPVENYYNNRSTVENIYYLEDIISTISTDLYVQYKRKTTINLSYASSSVDIDGAIKCKNNLYFINNYKSTYSSYVTLDNNTDNKLKVLIVNSDISGSNIYTVRLYLNGTQIQELQYTDKDSLYNDKIVTLYSSVLGTYINITQPLYLNVNDYIEYTVYTIYVTEEVVLHKYMCIYDKINSALIFSTKYTNEEISILLQSRGSLLRASTINSLYTVNSQSFFQYDESLSKITIVEPKLYKDGDKIRYVNKQSVIIDPEQLNVGYSLLGIYIDEDNNLLYDSITSNVNYSILIDSLYNYTLDNVRKNRSYYGFIIGSNNITKFVPLDIQLYNTSGGSGSGGTSSISKVSYDFINIDSLTITFTNDLPLIVIYNENGDQIIPQNIHYNYSDEIVITFGEYVTGKVVIL